MNASRAALLAAGLAASAAAQTTPSALHAAWLREMLDLDPKAASQAYLAIARDERAPAIERQIAAARLEELRRIGAPAASGDTAPEALPPGLRTQPDAATQEELRKSISAILGAATAPRAAAPATPGDRGNDANLPSLRPLVQFVVQSARDDERQERSASIRFQPFGGPDSTRVIERIRAHEIARAEIAGRAQDAEDIRQRAFPTWKPQPWPQDRKAAWQTVRENLVRWQQERQLSGTERDILARLLTTLDADAQQSVDLALARLDRLPMYVERLRADVPAPR